MGGRAVAAVLGAILGAAGCRGTTPEPPTAPAAAEPEEWDRELPPEVRLASFGEEATHAPVRVVADATGEPIAGARIDNWWEPDLPHVEPWPKFLEQSAVTDRDGWAVLRSKRHGHWFYVEAPGWAPLGEMGFFKEFRLQPGIDFPLELRDWLDRPVPGAAVELLLGCGHTPTARSGVTGPDGRLLLRCVDPGRGSLWIQAPGLEGNNATYWRGFDFLPLEDGAHVLRVDPSPPVEGRVLRADGTPASGAIAGTRDGVHRGPWTRTDSEGRFRLLGVEPRSRMVAYEAPPDTYPDGVEAPQVWFASLPGVFHTVRLPAPEKEEQDEAELEDGVDEDDVAKPPAPRLLVRMTAAEGADPLGNVGLALVREGDGLAQEDSAELVEGAAEATLEVEPGTWAVTAGDVSGRFRPETKRVLMGAEGAEVSFVLAANPTWNPRVVERAGDGSEAVVQHPRPGEFKVTTAVGVEEATPSAADDGSIHVPAAGPFAVEYEAPDGRRARKVLRGPPAGEGPVLVLPPPEDAPSDPPLMSVPYDGDFAEERLQVLLPGGAPAAGARVTVSGSPAPNLHYVQHLSLDGEGSLRFAFRRHDRVEVEGGDGLPPLVAHVEGPGPWTLRWPESEIEVRAEDAAGAAVPEFAVVVPGAERSAAGGVVRLRGMPAGPVRIWVEAPGYRAHEVRLVLAEGEKRKVVVRMTPR